MTLSPGDFPLSNTSALEETFRDTVQDSMMEAAANGNGHSKADLPPKERASAGQVVAPRRPVVVSMAELAERDAHELPSLPFLGQEGYVCEGFSTLIASYPKVGKSTLATQLVQGWLFLGKRVLYMTEEPEQIWSYRLKGSGWEGGEMCFVLGRQRDELLEIAFSGKHDIVVLDTLRSVLQMVDERDNSEVARVAAPWIARARETGTTLIGLAHDVKSGGEHGRGIAGGHALFGLFDAALEIERVPGLETRRRVSCYARLVAPPELLYELTEDGTLKALGDARAVELEDVADRLRDVLDDRLRSRSELTELLGDPKPGKDVMSRALAHLVSTGEAERDPVESKKGVTYRWRLRTSLAEVLPIGGRSGSTLNAAPDIDYLRGLIAKGEGEEVPDEQPCIACGEGTSFRVRGYPLHVAGCKQRSSWGRTSGHSFGVGWS